MVPLVLVYWAEYAIQAGAWTAFALPPGDLHDGAARQRAYELLNLCYQVGVFFSRSSGNMIVLRTRIRTRTRARARARTRTRTRTLTLTLTLTKARPEAAGGCGSGGAAR